MSERNTYRENIKSLLDKWNTDFEKLKGFQKDNGGALKDLKHGLENSWNAFDNGFE